MGILLMQWPCDDRAPLIHCTAECSKQNDNLHHIHPNTALTAAYICQTTNWLVSCKIY